MNPMRVTKKGCKLPFTAFFYSYPPERLAISRSRPDNQAYHSIFPERNRRRYEIYPQRENENRPDNTGFMLRLSFFPCTENYIRSLRIYIRSLRIYIRRLRIYIRRLRIRILCG